VDFNSNLVDSLHSVLIIYIWCLIIVCDICVNNVLVISRSRCVGIIGCISVVISGISGLVAHSNNIYIDSKIFPCYNSYKCFDG